LKELLAAGIRLEKAEHGRLGFGFGVEIEMIEPEQRLDNQRIFGRIRILSQQCGACAKQAEREESDLPWRQSESRQREQAEANHSHAEDERIERKK
jgi:hypothetical protein